MARLGLFSLESTLEQVQNPQTPTEEVPEEAGSLEAAALAFVKREQGETQAVEAEAETTEETTDTEAVEAEPEAEEEAVELAEVEFEGLKLSLPKEDADKLQKGVLRQSEFSRRMNELGEKDKVLTHRQELAETIVNGASEYAASLAELQIANARLKQFEAINWQQIRQENPAEFAALAAEVQGVRLAKDQAESKAKGLQAQIKEKQDQLLQNKRASMFKALETSFKGWKDETGAAITEYATKNGVAYETLATLTDPGIVIALDKARKFDELQQKRANLKPSKDVPPVLKPGAPRKVDPKMDSLAKLRKSNSVDDAAEAFLARMR